MNLEEQFKEETGLSSTIPNYIHSDGYYSQDYVEWLEEKLTIHAVSVSKKTFDIVCKALYNQYDFDIRRYPDDSISYINEDEVTSFVKKELS